MGRQFGQCNTRCSKQISKLMTQKELPSYARYHSCGQDESFGRRILCDENIHCDVVKTNYVIIARKFGRDIRAFRPLGYTFGCRGRILCQNSSNLQALRKYPRLYHFPRTIDSVSLNDGYIQATARIITPLPRDLKFSCKTIREPSNHDIFAKVNKSRTQTQYYKYENKYR